jgi:thioredoxin-related protein
MKKLLLVLTITIIALQANAQTVTAPVKPLRPTDTAKLYHPNADAKADIASAVKRAAAGKKHVLLQLGGNWCIWCIYFNDLVKADPELDKYLRANYEVVHVNYSPENKNEAVLASLEYPQRFGFPVFVVLDGNGKRLHTQNSAYLEEGKGHSKAKVMEFFKNWAPIALDAKSYEAKGK